MHGAPVGQPTAAISIPAVLLIAWGCGFITVLFLYWQRWRPIHLAKRQASPLNLPLEINVLSSPALLEPAVLGVFRPVLLLPEAITSRLMPAQLEAVFAHELCHVRRRDNLTAALHMIVEAIFWFHPIVWWLGARLVAERERACDEAVVQAGNEPQVYAEAILEVCKLYLESRLACAAGVSGANLTARVERIMTARIELRLGLAGKLLLATAGISAIATPLVVGMVIAPPRQAQSYPPEQSLQSSATLSIKLSRSPQPSPGFNSGPYVSMNPGDFAVRNASLKDLIRFAYNIPRFRIAGGPGWVDNHHYEISAKQPWGETVGPVLQALLLDRFKLQIHRETRELPVYALEVARSGLKLRPSKESCSEFELSRYPGQWPASRCGAIDTGPNIRLNHTLEAIGMSMTGTRGNAAGLTNLLTGELDRPVVDKTGLKGLFDLHLEWNREATARVLGSGGLRSSSESTRSEDDSPSIFDAVQEQLGLQLEPNKASFEVLVMDQAEKPFE